MAITLQTANITSSNFGSATSYTLPVTVSAGTNTKLIASFQYEGTDAVSSVKWNTSETFTAGKAQQVGNSAFVYYLDAPTVKSDNVVVTKTGVARFGNVGAIPIDGTLTGIGNTNGGNGTDAVSLAVTTTVDNSLIVDSLYQNNNALAISVSGTNQTERYRNSNADGWRGLGSTETTTTAGSYTMSWSGNSGAANTWVYVIVEIEPSATATPTVQSPTLLLMGVG